MVDKTTETRRDPYREPPLDEDPSPIVTWGPPTNTPRLDRLERRVDALEGVYQKLLAEERAHADRLAKVLSEFALGEDFDASAVKYAKTFLSDHEKRREKILMTKKDIQLPRGWSESKNGDLTNGRFGAGEFRVSVNETRTKVEFSETSCECGGCSEVLYVDMDVLRYVVAKYDEGAKE